MRSEEKGLRLKAYCTNKEGPHKLVYFALRPSASSLRTLRLNISLQSFTVF